MTLAVVTLQFGELPYFEDSAAINAAYCSRHGLEWTVCGAQDIRDRNLVWSKVAIVAQTLKRADTVLFLDADAIFVDHSIGPAGTLRRLGTKPMLFALDQAGRANTGVILARRCEATSRILAKWWAVPTRDTTHAYQWPLEEGALNKHIVGKHSHEFGLAPVGDLNIKHYAGVSLAEKTKKLSRERTTHT